MSGSTRRFGDTHQLRRSLKRRHMSLISIGGVVGAGLFVGSGVMINEAGPAVILSFLAAGLLTVLLMRMLGEMAAAEPALGSFYAYARKAFGSGTGFVTGWLYWYFYVMVIAVETVAGGRLIQGWLPQLPLWAPSLGVLLLLTATNLISARSYGEFEYWFSSIKVVAIVVFLVVGLCYLFGWWPSGSGGWHNLGNLVSHGGFAPNGIGAVVAVAVAAAASYTGGEIVTVAAAESTEPRKAVARAANSVILRVMLFYVGSLFLIVTVVPWNSPRTSVSPFGSLLEALHMPQVGLAVNIVVLTAVLSCLNSSLYTCSRMIFALTRNGDAPRSLTKLNSRGVPARSVLLGTVAALAAVVAAVFSPDTIFAFLINSYGAIALMVYVVVAASQIKLRRRTEQEHDGNLPVRMWGFPYLSYLTLGGMVAVILALAFIPGSRAEFGLGLLAVAVVVIAYRIRKRRGRSRTAASDGLLATVPGQHAGRCPPVATRPTQSTAGGTDHRVGDEHDEQTR